MDFSYDVNLSKLSEEKVKSLKEQDLCPMFKELFIDYTDAFKNCKQEVLEDTLKVTSNFEIEKIKEDKIVSGGINDAKKELESDGYVCTIK